MYVACSRLHVKMLLSMQGAANMWGAAARCMRRMLCTLGDDDVRGMPAERLSIPSMHVPAT